MAVSASFALNALSSTCGCIFSVLLIHVRLLVVFLPLLLAFCLNYGAVRIFPTGLFFTCGEYFIKKRPTRVGLEMKMELPYSAAGISAAGCAEGSSAAGAAGIVVAGICAGA